MANLFWFKSIVEQQEPQNGLLLGSNLEIAVLGLTGKVLVAGEGLTLEMFMEDCLPWKAPHAGTRKECEESSPEEEGVAEILCD